MGGKLSLRYIKTFLILVFRSIRDFFRLNSSSTHNHQTSIERIMSSDYYSNYFNNKCVPELMFSSLYIAFDITALNSSGTPLHVMYGIVNEWWLSHPNKLNIYTQGFIQVC